MFNYCTQDWNERDEDTGLIIERILILVRNVLHVPANLEHEKRPENDASIHDQVCIIGNPTIICMFYNIILYSIFLESQTIKLFYSEYIFLHALCYLPILKSHVFFIILLYIHRQDIFFYSRTSIIRTT